MKNRVREVGNALEWPPFNRCHLDHRARLVGRLVRLVQLSWWSCEREISCERALQFDAVQWGWELFIQTTATVGRRA